MTASQPSPSDAPSNIPNNDSSLNLESINDYLPLRRSNRGKGKGTSGLSSHGSSSNLNDDKIQFCHVNGIEYRVGDYVYFEEADFEYYTIGLIEEIKLSRREKCSLIVKCFWRRWDILDAAKDSLLEREIQESEDYDEFSLPSSELMKRELFISDLQSNVYSQQLRGICTVIQLPDLTSVTKFFDPSPDNKIPADTFFYIYSFDPETKRLVSTRNEPKIGSAHQPELPDIRKSWDELEHSSQEDVKKAYENYVIASNKRNHCENCPSKYESDIRLTWEELIWKPNESEANEDSLKTFLDAVRSIVAFLSFGGAKDDASSAENGLVLANCSATTQHAYNVLYKCNFDIEESLRQISQEPFPIEDIPQHWSADEVRLFYHAMSIHGKDFHAIQRNFFNGSYQLPNALMNDDEAIENKAPRGNRRGYRRSNSVTKDETKKENENKQDSDLSSSTTCPNNSESQENKNETEPSFDKKETEANEFSKPSDNPYTCYPGPTRSVKQLVSFYYYWKKKNTQAGIIQQGNLKGRLPMPVNGIDKVNGQNGDSELNLPPSQAIDIAKKRRNQQTSYSKSSKFRKAGKASAESNKNIKTINSAQRKGWIAIHENRLVVKEQLASMLREKSGLSEKILREEDEENEAEEEDEDVETDEKNQNEDDNASESSSIQKEEDFQPAVKIYLQKSPNDPLQTWSCKTNEEANIDDELDKTIEATNSGERTDSGEYAENTTAPLSNINNGNQGSFEENSSEPIQTTEPAKKNRICRNCHAEIQQIKQTVDSDSEEQSIKSLQVFFGQLKFLCQDCRIYLQKYGELRSISQIKTEEESMEDGENTEDKNPEEMPDKSLQEMKNNLDETLEEVKPHSEFVPVKSENFSASSGRPSLNGSKNNLDKCFCRNCKSNCSTLNSEGFCCKHENLVPMTVFDDCCCCQTHVTVAKCIDRIEFDQNSLDLSLSENCKYQKIREENFRPLKVEAYYLNYDNLNFKTSIDEKYGIKRRHEDEESSEDSITLDNGENGVKRVKLENKSASLTKEVIDDEVNLKDIDSDNEEQLNDLIRLTALSKPRRIDRKFIEKTWCKLNKLWDRKISFQFKEQKFVNLGSCARTDLVYTGKSKDSHYIQKRIELYCQYASTALGPGIEQLPQPFKDIAIANMSQPVKPSAPTNSGPSQTNGNSSPSINKSDNQTLHNSSKPVTSATAPSQMPCNSAKLQEFAKALNNPGFSTKDFEKFLALNGQLPPNASPEMVKACLMAMGINPNKGHGPQNSQVNNPSNPFPNPHQSAIPNPQHQTSNKGPQNPIQHQSSPFLPPKINNPLNSKQFPQPHIPQMVPPQPQQGAQKNQNFEEFQKFLLSLGKAGSSSNPELELTRLMAMGMFGQHPQQMIPPNNKLQPTPPSQLTQQNMQPQKQKFNLPPPMPPSHHQGPMRHPSGGSRNSGLLQPSQQVPQNQSKPHQQQSRNPTANQFEAMKQQKQMDQFQKFLMMSMAGGANAQPPSIPPPSQPQQQPLPSNPIPNNANELEKARLLAMLSSVMGSNQIGNQATSSAAATNQMNALLQSIGFMNNKQPPQHQPSQSQQQFMHPDNLKNKTQLQNPPFLGQSQSSNMNPLEAVFASLKNSQMQQQQQQQIPGFPQSSNIQDPKSLPNSFLSQSSFSHHPKSLSSQNQRNSVNPPSLHHQQPQNRHPHLPHDQFSQNPANMKPQFQPNSIFSNNNNNNSNNSHNNPIHHQQPRGGLQLPNAGPSSSSHHNRQQQPILHQPPQISGQKKNSHINNNNTGNSQMNKIPGDNSAEAFMTALLSNLANQGNNSNNSNGQQIGAGSNGQDVAEALNAFLQHAVNSSNSDIANRQMNINNGMSSNQLMQAQRNRSSTNNNNSTSSSQLHPTPPIPPIINSNNNMPSSSANNNNTSNQNAVAMDYYRIMNQLAMASQNSSRNNNNNQSLNNRR